MRIEQFETRISTIWSPPGRSTVTPVVAKSSATALMDIKRKTRMALRQIAQHPPKHAALVLGSAWSLSGTWLKISLKNLHPMAVAAFARTGDGGWW